MARKGNKKNKKPLKIIDLNPSQKIRETKNKIFNFLMSGYLILMHL